MPQCAAAVTEDRMARTDARILLADDMKTILMIEDSLFRGLGFCPVLAESGTAALKALLSGDIELAFLDYFMPDMNGPDVIRLFEESQPKKKPAFIAVTSDIRGSEDTFTAEGFDSFLEKPLDAGKVLEILKRYIPKDR